MMARAVSSSTGHRVPSTAQTPASKSTAWSPNRSSPGSDVETAARHRALAGMAGGQHHQLRGQVDRREVPRRQGAIAQRQARLQRVVERLAREHAAAVRCQMEATVPGRRLPRATSRGRDPFEEGRAVGAEQHVAHRPMDARHFGGLGLGIGQRRHAGIVELADADSQHSSAVGPLPGQREAGQVRCVADRASLDEAASRVALRPRHGVERKQVQRPVRAEDQPSPVGHEVTDPGPAAGRTPVRRPGGSGRSPPRRPVAPGR